MRNQKLSKALIIACCVVLLWQPAGVLGSAADGPSSSTHALSWLSGSTRTTISADKTIMTTTPSQNYLSEHVLNLNFSLTGNAAKGGVEIRVPAKLFKDRDGNDIGTVTVPLLQAPDEPQFGNRFNYYIDDTANEVVIVNTAPIDGNFFLTVDLKYQVKPDQVKMTWAATDSEYVYARNFTATMKATTTDGKTGTFTSNPVTLRYKTSADLDSLSKSRYTTYTRWPSVLGPSPTPRADGTQPADDYFYVAWNIYASSSTDDTMPFDVFIRENNPPSPEYGEMIGFSDYASSGWKAGNVARFNEYFNPRPAAITTPYPYSSRDGNYWNPYVIYRYPNELLAYDPVTKTERATVKNQVQGEVRGFDGVSNILDASASTVFVMPTPTPVPTATPAATAPPDTSYGVKYNSGASYGLINRLESGKESTRPWLLTYTYPASTQAVGNFYVRSLYNRAWYDSYQDGEYGVRDHTFEWTDNRVYLGGTGINNKLTNGDYQMTRLRVPGWTEYGPNITATSYGMRTKAADEHRPITILVEKNGAWSELGTVEKFLQSGATRYRYTPVTGDPVVYTSFIDISLPAGTTGVRFRHVTSAVYVSYGYLYMETELLNSAAVLNYLKNRDSAYVYNYFDAKATDGDGNTRTRSDYHYHQITRITPRSYDSKTRTEPKEDLEGQRYYVDYTVTMYDETTNPGGMSKEDIIAENMLPEQRQSTFYDLLPPGTTVNLDSIQVRGYYPPGNPLFSHRVEIRDNWKGSGRTMLIVHAQAPEGVQNYYHVRSGSYAYLRTGMVMTFRLYNTWGNVVDNGTYLVNAVAYESHDGALGTGYADVPSSDIPYNLRSYMTDLNGDGNPADRPKNFLYANVTLDYTPLRAFETGFSKAVASPEDPVFDEHTEVMPGGSYTYRLRLNNPLARTKDLVFYDVLETAYKNQPHWQGTLAGVDTTHVANKGVNAKVYYTTSTTITDMQIAADSSHLDNNIGTIWSETAPADLGTVTAVAIDLRTKTNGQPYIAEAGESVLVNINMQAPVKDVQGFIDGGVLAHNRGLLANRKSTIGGGDFDPVLAIEACDPVTVGLRNLGLDFDKFSSPASGTAGAPVIVHGGQQLDYHISVKNNNVAQAILDIQIEDTIPDGLEIDYTNVAYLLDDNPTSRRLVKDSTRVGMLADGQKLYFTINSLAGNEKMTFIVPTRVMSALTDTTANPFVNQTHIKKIFGKDYDLASPKTYHRESVVTVPLTGTKKLTGRALVEGEFTFVLKNSEGEVLQRVTNQAPAVTGGQEALFAFASLGFNAPGTYVFTLEEEKGTLDSVEYDDTLYTITVTVTADAQGELQQPVVTYAVGNAAKTALTFENIYRTRSFTATKEWKIRDGGTEVPSDNAPYPNVEFQLYRDGEPYGAIETLAPTGTPAPGYPVTTGTLWENLPLYRADGLTDVGGNRIESQYTVQEVIVPDGYVMQRLGENTIQNIYWPNARTVHKIWDGPIPEPKTVTVEMTIWQEIRKIGKLPSDPYDYIRKYDVGVIMDGQADDYTNPEYDPADPFTLYGEFEPWKFTIILPSSGTYNGDQVNYYYVVEEKTITGLDNDYKVGEIVIEKAKGANVTNVYQFTSFTANKVWEGGINNRPEKVTLYLERSADSGATWERVTGSEYEDNNTVLDNNQHTWTGLTRFADWDTRREYIYRVREETVLNYTTTYPDNTTVTNTYVIPKTSYKAIKTWVDGPEADHTGVFVNLYRQTDQMTEPEHILLPPGLFVRDDSEASSGKFTYNWTVLDATDINGNPYTYFAREAGVSDAGTVVANGNLYQVEQIDQKDENGKIISTHITNTYVVPKVDVHATKTWANLSAEAAQALLDQYAGSGYDPYLDVWFKLYRAHAQTPTAFEEVSGAGILHAAFPVPQSEAPEGTEPEIPAPGPDGTQPEHNGYHASVTWENLPKTDKTGADYLYIVREVDQAGNPLTLGNFTRQEDGLDVTNTYFPTKDGVLQDHPCQFEWYAEAIADPAGKDWTNTNHTYMVGQGPGHKGVMMVQHEGNPVTWRVPIATDHALINGKITVDLSQYLGAPGDLYDTDFSIVGYSTKFSDTLTAQECFDRFTHSSAAGATYTLRNDLLGTPAISPDGKTMTISVPYLPANSAVMFQFQFDRALPAGERAVLGVTFAGDYHCLTGRKLWQGGQTPPDEVVLTLVPKTPLTVEEALDAMGAPSGGFTREKTFRIVRTKDGEVTTDELRQWGCEVAGIYPEFAALIQPELKGVFDAWPLPPEAEQKPEDLEKTVTLSAFKLNALAQLLADAWNQPIIQRVLGSADGEYAHVWAHLPMDEVDDHLVKRAYRMLEDPIEGFVQVGYVEDTDHPSSTYITLTNSAAVTVTAAKVWQGGPAADHTPVRLILKQNGAALDPQPEAVVTGEGPFTYTWSGLPETDAGGKPHVYTVEEQGVADGRITVKESGNLYEVTQQGNEITNTYVVPLIEVSGRKTWDDANNQAGKRPEKITVNLLKNGVQIDARTVTAADNWSWTFSGLAKYEAAGQLIHYAIHEESTPDYSSIVSGYNVTNTHTPGKTSVQVTKAWADGNNQDGKRPDSVTIRLLADGADTGKTLVLTPANHWTGTFTELDVFKPGAVGQRIAYTVEEVPVGSGYGSGVVTGDAARGYVVTNIRGPEQVDVTATKTWVNGPAADHTSVTLILKQNGVALDPQPEAVAAGEGPFTYTWSDLPQTDNNGIAYTYTVEEAGVIDGHITIGSNQYAVTQNGNDITNTYVAPKAYTFVPRARKVLEGGALTAGQFTFLYTDHEGKAHTVTNRADGSIDLPILTLSQAGTYTFQLAEAAGDDSLILYDQAQYILSITLAVNGKNELAVVSGGWTRDGRPYAQDEVLFTNSAIEPTTAPTDPPTPEPTLKPTVEPVDPPAPPAPTYPTLEVPLKACKVLRNGVLRDGEFTFVLKDAKGNVLAEVRNLADGTVPFPNRTFSRAVRNYQYTVTEKAGADDTITYDTTVYTVKVTTTAVDGRLQAQVDVLRDGVPYAGELVFANTRQAPRTGDSTVARILLLLALAGVLGASALLMRRRRKTKRDS